VIATRSVIVMVATAVTSWVAAVALAAARWRLPARAARLVGAGARPASRRVRRLAIAMCSLLVGWLVHPVLGLALLLAAPLVHRGRAARAARVEASRIGAAMPELLDLIAAAMGAGCSAREAVLGSQPVAPEALRPALARLEHRLQLGQRFADALQHLGSDLGEPARALVSALRAHARDGVPVRPTLERIAADAHRLRRQQCEQAIRRLPVRLSIPLVTCTLSAFVVLTVVPLGAATLRSLRGELAPAAATGGGLGTAGPDPTPTLSEVPP
jgi:tight adherence protein C